MGDAIHIVGHTTDLCQHVKSLQIDYHAVREAVPGNDVALQVLDRVREGDRVFKIDERNALEFLAERNDIAAAYA